MRPDIVTGHDFRSYTCAVKQALTLGLVASGSRVLESQEMRQTVLKAIELEFSRYLEVGEYA